MIQLRHIDKKYKEKQVLYDFTLDIDMDGHIYGLIGPNGAGKTTLIKIIAGLLDFSGGEIQAENSKNYAQWTKENIVLILAGERGLRYKNTVYDNVMFFGTMKGVSEKRIKTLLLSYAEQMSFTEFLHRRVETLSLGEKKKALLLCGLCTDMEVIMMDEPSNGLDVDGQIEMKLLIKEMAEKSKKTFIISSHDITLLSEIADRYVFIFGGHNAGQIETKLKPEDIQKRYLDIKEQFGGKNEKLSECN